MSRVLRIGRCGLAGLSLVLVLAVPVARAQVAPSVIGGQYSPRLQAEFFIGPVWLPGYGTFTAARIVSYPEPGSPLNQVGLTQGDVITRLDGIPVASYAELENHYSWTTVRFIRHGTYAVLDGQMFIPYGMAPPGPIGPAPTP